MFYRWRQVAFATMPLDSPSSLAAGVAKALEASNSMAPALQTLERLFETMYAASVHTEEGEPIAFHVAYMNPANPDPAPPPRIRRYRWRVWPLAATLPFDIPSLVKLAKASDPRSSSLAVYRIKGKLQIWGLIDQGTHYFDYMNHDSQNTQAERPGVFQASVEGVAHVVAWLDFYKIAELRGTTLLGPSTDALESDPIYGKLVPNFESLLTGIEATCKNTEDLDDAEAVARRIVRTWLGALRRSLLRARSYRHGGAVLIVPDHETSLLNVKYQIEYSRLCEAMQHQIVEELKERRIRNEIFAESKKGATSLSMPTYFEKQVASNELRDLEREVNSAVWFISLLTRIDGLVLLDTDTRVRGFGVEITAGDPPARVCRARNRTGTRLSEIDYNHYGTRHRSMMRLCAAIAASVGFVISQDGAVRAMTAGDDCVIVWEDLLVQRLKSEPPTSRTGWGRRPTGAARRH